MLQFGNVGLPLQIVARSAIIMGMDSNQNHIDVSKDIGTRGRGHDASASRP